MTHSAAMAAEILPGKTVLEALNTDLVCDAINVAMRELFLQIVLRPQPDAPSPKAACPSAPAWKTWARAFAARWARCSRTQEKGVRYLEMAEGYVLSIGAGRERRNHRLQVRQPWQDDGRHHARASIPKEAYEKNISTYGRFDEAVQVHRPAQAVRKGGAQQWSRFEGYERRIDKINKACSRNTASTPWKTSRALLDSKGIDVEKIVHGRAAHRV